MTGNLKICLRVVEPPEETLLLAPRAREGGIGDVDVDDDDDDGDSKDGSSTNYTANGDIAFINSFAAATGGAKEEILSAVRARRRARFRTGIARSS